MVEGEVLFEHSDLAWFGMTQLDSVESFIIAAGSGTGAYVSALFLRTRPLSV